MEMSSLPPLLQHFDYVALDQTCKCQVCEDWREKHRRYEAAMTGHQRSCMCASCRHMRELARAYHAARTRREVFCEMSFHAGWGDLPDAEKAMSWVYEHIMSAEISDGWWSKRAPYYPMEHWFRQAEKGIRTAAIAVSGALAIVVSGALTLAVAVSGIGRSDDPPAEPIGGPPSIEETNEDIMTASSAIIAMKKEAEQLEAQLQQSPLYRRFVSLTGFIESYTRDHLDPAILKAEKAVGPAVRKMKQGANRAAAAVATDTEALIQAAKSFLRNHGGPAFGKDIAAGLKEVGVAVPGNQPGRTLGIVLSRHDDFDYDKKTGFSLKS